MSRAEREGRIDACGKKISLCYELHMKVIWREGPAVTMLEEWCYVERARGGGDASSSSSSSSEQRGWVGSMLSFGDGGLSRANSCGQCNLRKAQATAWKRDGPSGGPESSEQRGHSTASGR